MNSLKKVVIFGATSAIAIQVARQIVGDGGSVFCVGRNNEKLERLLYDLRARAASDTLVGGVSAELLEFEKHSALISQAADFLGGLDGALVCHGSLPNQKVCESSVSVTLHELNVNAISAIGLLTELGNVFEEKKEGVIAAISSVAGDRGRQSNYVYGASKGMLSIFMQGLRNRLTKTGVDVVTIKPGFVDTPMTDGLDKSSFLWAKPETVAQGVVLAMRKGKPVVYLPRFWQLIMLVVCSIPEVIFSRLSL